jgi:hypothetical protein
MKKSTFTISITKDSRERKTIRKKDSDRIIFGVHPSFAIGLNIKDSDLLYRIQAFFGVGKIKK